MVRLKVINLRQVNNHYFKILFIIIVCVLSIVLIFKNINFSEIKENLKININEITFFEYKNILGKEFVFLKDNFNNSEEYKNIQNRNDFKLGVLKKSIEGFGIVEIDKSIETFSKSVLDSSDEIINNSKELINSEFVYVKKSNENVQDTNNIAEEKSENNNNTITEEKNIEIVDDGENKNLDIPNKLETKVIEEKNKVDKYNVTYGNVKIRNESKYEINDSIFNLDFKINNKNNIIIYHTHTCESYTPTEKYNYIQSGNYRSIDLRYSVVKVGDVLEENLKQRNYNVLHAKDYHDYPAYNGSYNRALTTINNSLNIVSSDIVIDLHRDALGNNSDYGPCIEINGERVAQLMFVIGTDGGGLNHNNWKQNLKFALEFQKKAEEMYPGLFKPMIVRNARYNQHVAKGAVIVEVGATGNTLEEAEGSMKYFSKVLDEYLKTN